MIILLSVTSLFIAFHYKMIWETWHRIISLYYLLILLSLGIYLLFLSRRLSFIENFIHELTHMLFAALTFQKISGLYVTASCGVVDTTSQRNSTLVTLSPYFFPLPTVALICLFSLIDFQYGKHFVIISYVLYLAITIKYSVRGKDELLSEGVTGILIVLILNFWISYFIWSWCNYMDINIKEILITIYNGITSTI